MDLKDRLVHSEIQHLGEVIQTLSYELVLLQEFLKLQFGPRFEAYRSKYADVTPVSPEARPRRYRTSESEPVNNRKSTKDCSISGRGEGSSFGESNDINMKVDNSSDLLENTSDNGSNLSMPNDVEGTAEINDSESNYDNPCSDEDITSKDPLSVRISNPEPKRGRRRKKIWRFYDLVHLSQNKVAARCHICKGMVSSRADRLVEHRIKCKTAERDDAGRIVKRYKQIKKKVLPNKRKSDSPTNAAINPVQREDKESFMDSDTNANTNSPRNSTSSRSGNKSSEKPVGGRSLGTIWQYFEVLTVDNLRKAKCLACRQFVSPKADRMTKHKAICGF